MSTKVTRRRSSILVGLVAVLAIHLAVAVPARADILPDTPMFSQMLSQEQARSLGVAARNITGVSHWDLLGDKRIYVERICPEQSLTGKAIPTVVYEKIIASTKKPLSAKKQELIASHELFVYNTAAGAVNAFESAQAKAKKCTGMQVAPDGNKVEVSNGSGTLANGNPYSWIKMAGDTRNQMTVWTLISVDDTRWFQEVELESLGKNAPPLTDAQMEQLLVVASESTETTGRRANEIWVDLVRCFNQDFSGAAGLCL